MREGGGEACEGKRGGGAEEVSLGPLGVEGGGVGDPEHVPHPSALRTCADSYVTTGRRQSKLSRSIKRDGVRGFRSKIR